MVARNCGAQNKSFVFFRVVGLSEDREAEGAQGVPLTPGRSIAVDKALHVYGTPFFIEADLPAEAPHEAKFRRLVVAQDTGSAIVGPARADIYYGAGDDAGRIAGGLRHPGLFALLVPRGLELATAKRPRATARATAKVRWSGRARAGVDRRGNTAAAAGPARQTEIAAAGMSFATAPRPPVDRRGTRAVARHRAFHQAAAARETGRWRKTLRRHRRWRAVHRSFASAAAARVTA